MEYAICFCTDGILRLKYGKKPMIPMSFVQQDYKELSEFAFWAKWWDLSVICEENITIGQFLSCLSPWTQFWSDYTGKDIQSFIEESKKPLLVKNETTEENKGYDLSWISLYYAIDMDLDIEYKHHIEELNGDINEWLHKKREARLTGDFEINGAYKLIGYKTGVVEHYGVEHIPMNELTNVKFVLNPKQILFFQDFNSKRILGNESGLFKNNAFGIRHEKIEEINYELTYAQAIKNHILKDVIEGFFLWFPHDPIERELFNDDIQSTINYLDFTKNNNNFGNDNEEVYTNNIITLPKNKENPNNQEDLSKTDNVINLFQQPNIDNINNSDNLNITIAPGAFDSLIDDYQQEDIFWNDLLHKASLDSATILKIGEIKHGKPPEQRIYQYIPKETDISTPFKII